MCLLAREPWIKLPIYALAQTLGAFLGAGIVFGLYYGKCEDFVCFLMWDYCVCNSLKGGRFPDQRGTLSCRAEIQETSLLCSGMTFLFSGWWVQASSKQSEGQPTLSKCKSLPLSNEHWTSGWPLLYLLVFQKSQWNTSSDGDFISVHCSRTISHSWLKKNEVFTVMSYALSCVSFQIMWLLADFTAFIRVVPYLGKHPRNPVPPASIPPVCFLSSQGDVQ